MHGVDEEVCPCFTLPYSYFDKLTYGLDYKGNVCGDRHANPDLRELEFRSWMNPDQVYKSGLKASQFRLADARSIYLIECPTPAEDGLNWVSDYPEGETRISVDDWIDRDYDYYEFLTLEVCWGLGYIVATLFFAVVMAIDTIILSFCQDAEEHQGTAQYAPPLLMKTLDGQGEMQRLTQGS